jgi:hypothetical protein
MIKIFNTVFLPLDVRVKRFGGMSCFHFQDQRTVGCDAVDFGSIY